MKDDLYVVDMFSGGNNFEQVTSLKDKAMEIFYQAGFELHKWHFNVSTLEEKEVATDDQTYSKQQLGIKINETKMLGLPWNKNEDTLAEEIASEVKKLTKRTIFQKLASIYDPLGIISPTTIIGKIIYRDVFDFKLP